MNTEKLELEKKLVGMRVKLFMRNMNMIGLSVSYFVFYPILMLMASMNDEIGARIYGRIMELSDEFDEMIDEFNTLVKHYNSL